MARSGIQNLTADSFQVAISFCRQDRALAREVARRLIAAGISVYYDEWNEVETVGRNLAPELKAIYYRRCVHCLAIVSNAYFESHWSKVEWESISSRLQEQGSESITVVSIDGAVPEGAKPHESWILHRHQASDISRHVLEKMGPETSSALNHLHRMRAACIAVAVPIALSAVLLFLVSPQLWLIHLLFCGWTSLLLIAIAHFFRAPFFIASAFLAISVLFVFVSGGRPGVPAGEGAAISLGVLKTVFGIPGLLLLIFTLCAAFAIRQNRRRYLTPLRDHPMTFLRSHPHLVLVGAQGDRMFHSIYKIAKAFRFRIRRCSIWRDHRKAVRWPSLERSSILIVSSSALTEALWNDPARHEQFQQWIQSAEGKVFAATSDGTLAPAVSEEVGYIDSHKTGAFRTVLFLIAGFSVRINPRHFSRLRILAMLGCLLSLIDVANLAIGHVSGQRLANFNYENSAVLWLIVASLWWLVWRTAYTRHWLTDLVFTGTALVALGSGVSTLQRIPELSVPFFVIGMVIVVNLIPKMVVRWRFIWTYFKARRASKASQL